SGRADLYYTVFGLQTLAAVEPAAFEPAPFEPAAGLSGVARRAKPEAAGDSQARSASLARQTRAYLRTFGDGADLDFVHLCCLARCWALLSNAAATEVYESIPARLKAFRADDGGYSHVPGADHGTAYGAFLALGAYEDAGVDPPDADRLAESLAGLRASGGGYAGTPGADAGAVPATAAIVVTLAGLGQAIDASTAQWLLGQQRPTGGWPAAPGAPTADLLSTATALHALAAAGGSLDDAPRAACLAFVESLAADDAGPPRRAGFRGHPADTVADCEYTFYGLLALGHLT
ncbi:MAG: prenyltransferase/squalene oxidase repeat-containing protein, partial [Planctomycetota bacterium]|nr:prenyltransferase/squalene oxidase repeat-containing protein [Planctomycetota bacterium]